MLTNMLKKTFWVFIFFGLTSVLYPLQVFTAERDNMEIKSASSPEGYLDDQEEQRKLLEILEKHTELATKTRLNADFVPGMVIVLYGDELEARGISTVGEAMALVPGIHFSLTSDKLGKTVLRGLPRIFASGHVKVLLNGAPLTTAFGIDPVPNMPIEQVERLEIMRGPGSAIHGEFAYAGVMNIITRKKDTRVFSSAETDETYKGGGIFSWNIPEKDFNLSLNVTGLTSEGANVSNPGTFRVMTDWGDDDYPVTSVPPDVLDPEAIPGDSFDGDKENVGTDDAADIKGEAATQENTDADRGKTKTYRAGILGLNYKDFSLNAYCFENSQEEFYQTDQWGVSATQELNFFPDLKASLNLGWQEQTFEPKNAELCIPGSDIYSNAWMYEFNYDESLFYGGIELLWEGWDRHTILTEWSFAKSELKDMRRNDSADKNNTGISATVLPPEFDERFPPRTATETGQELEGKDRLINSLTIQDEFRLNDQFTLTAGMRYDHYDDIGEKFSPRIAAVCRLNKKPGADRHILKAQYARAFRPPTFLEIYAKEEPDIRISDIQSETIDTYELGYIYRNIQTVGRLTFFYSDIKSRTEDMLAEPERFYSSGAELELERPLIPDVLKFDGNLSYTNTKSRDTDREIPETADWLANAGLIYRPSRSLLFALQYYYVGERVGYDGEHISGYHTADFALSIFNLGIEGLTLRAGVKNIFEEDVRYYSSRPDEGDCLTLAGDLSDDLDESDSGRWWWIKISYEF